MERDRWALAVMGAWIAGTIFVSVVATQNFHVIDRLIAGSNSEIFHVAIDELGPPRGGICCATSLRS
jgi:hypothetical protein